jgi:hypothetical protein
MSDGVKEALLVVGMVNAIMATAAFWLLAVMWATKALL